MRGLGEGVRDLVGEKLISLLYFALCLLLLSFEFEWASTKACRGFC